VYTYVAAVPRAAGQGHCLLLTNKLSFNKLQMGHPNTSIALLQHLQA
jgi:hypothetical protein